MSNDKLIFSGKSSPFSESILNKRPSAESIRARLDQLCSGSNLLEFNQNLRLIRHEIQSGLVYRLLKKIDDYQDTVNTTTLFAELVLEICCNFHYRRLAKRLSVPKDSSFVFLGLGKLGGYELNLSSDIDLIFVYAIPENCSPNISDRCRNFFRTFVNEINLSLSRVDEDGFVFRVDFRLRPWGNSGPMVISLEALKEYYEIHGRDWERYAWIKSRPVAGDMHLGKRIIKAMIPFIYRRYPDFGVIASIRDLHRQIQIKEQKTANRRNIKLGQGGIREVEFFAQYFQLLRGGQILELRSTNCLKTLAILSNLSIISAEVTKILTNQYLWLRQLEHVIQARNDEQVHSLPDNSKEINELANALGYGSADDFNSDFYRRTKIVNSFFNNLLQTKTYKRGSVIKIDQFRSYERESLQKIFLDYSSSRSFRNLDAIAQSRFEKLFPELELELLTFASPVALLNKLIPILEQCARRSVYLSLLNEVPLARKRMLDLVNYSQFITQQLVKMPILLDELISVKQFNMSPTKKKLRNLLRRQMAPVDLSDTEKVVEAFVYFLKAHEFQLALAQLDGKANTEIISSYMSRVCEIILQSIYEHAKTMLVRMYGSINTDSQGVDTIILAYGKLGSGELGFGSDLDLVFIHSINKGSNTSGPKIIDGELFIQRFVQRLINLMTANTRFGNLFDIDLRLRPSGKNGLLVQHIDAFSIYLENNAWVWEIQSLLRARVVAGDDYLKDKVEAIRLNILTKKRDQFFLRDKVREMRIKVDEFGNQNVNSLKKGRGGIIDIEFLIQFKILVYSNAYPSVIKTTGHLTQLKQLCDLKLISSTEFDQLSNAYLIFRLEINHSYLKRLEKDVCSIGQETRDIRFHKNNVLLIWKSWIKH